MPQGISYKDFSVLFVDDEEKNLKYFNRAFAKDFDIKTASSVSQAGALLEQHGNQIAILITDQCMPEKTGIDLLKHARKHQPHIIRMLTTAYADLNNTIDAINGGEVFRYIAKPWDVDNLMEILANAMELFFIRQNERGLLEEKQRTMQYIAHSIAHETRTPLLSIQYAASGTKRYLPSLLDVYEQALERQESVPSIPTAHRKILASTLENIELEAQRANTVIDMILMNAGINNFDPSQFDDYSISTCVKDALAHYPFQEQQRAKVHFEPSDDFLFYGSEVLLSYVLFNVIKNALYAIKAAGKGEISIRIERGKTSNRLYFKDTGSGIAKAILPHIFDNYFTTKSTGVGTGMGLSFCKKVLATINASIECNAEQDSYTEFVIQFPMCKSIIKQPQFH